MIYWTIYPQSGSSLVHNIIDYDKNLKIKHAYY